MLSNMRNGVFSGLFLVLLVMGAAGLVLTDAGGFFGSGIKTSDVAKVGSHTINSRPFDTKMRRIVAMQGIEPEAAFELGLVHQALFREVRNLLLLQGANDLGVMVSDEKITDYINEILVPYMREDTTSKKSEIFAAILRQNGMTESLFIDEARTEMTNNVLISAVSNASVHIPKIMQADIDAFSKETRDIEYVVFNNKDAKLENKADEETLQRYYKSFQERYRIPEKRDFTVAKLSQDKIKGDLKVSDEDALALYEENKGSYTKPRKHKIAQALADSEGDALKIKDAAEKGKPLSRAATSVTGDEASFIDTQAYQEGSLPQELDKDAFAEGVKKGDILGPYETALGWHVLKIVDVIPETTPEFKDVKDEIKAEMLDEQLWDTLDQTLTEIEDRIFGGDDAASIVADFGMETESFKGINKTGYTDGSKESPLKEFNSEDALNILTAANDLASGEVSNVIELSDSALGFVVLDGIEESRIKDYETVKDTVKKQWTKEQKDNATFMKAKAIADKVNDGSTSWKDAAKQSKRKNKKASISRSVALNDEKLEKDITPRGRNILLTSEIDKAQIIPGTDKTLVAYVKNTSLLKEEAAKGSTEEDGSIAALAEAQNLRQEALALLYNALQLEYKYQINEKLLNFLYNQPAQQ